MTHFKISRYEGIIDFDNKIYFNKKKKKIQEVERKKRKKMKYNNVKRR